MQLQFLQSIALLARLACREGEMARRREMRIQAACGRLEALYAGRMARMDKLASHFLRTATGPSLYWCPGKPCRELAPLEEQQVGALWARSPVWLVLHRRLHAWKGRAGSWPAQARRRLSRRWQMCKPAC